MAPRGGGEEHEEGGVPGEGRRRRRVVVAFKRLGKLDPDPSVGAVKYKRPSTRALYSEDAGVVALSALLRALMLRLHGDARDEPRPFSNAALSLGRPFQPVVPSNRFCDRSWPLLKCLKERHTLCEGIESSKDRDGAACSLREHTLGRS